MILSDITILEYIKNGKITILPDFDLKDVRPVGIRLHLGDELLIPEADQIIDLSGGDDVKHRKIIIPEGGYIIKPGEFILATTRERFQVPRDIVCHVDGRSTIARFGLSIHCTSQIVDGNFDEVRSIVLEMKNISPYNLLIKPRLAIAMLTFTKLSTPISQQSQSQYRGQTGVMPPNLKVQKK
jgi:dCTP deaminase